MEIEKEKPIPPPNFDGPVNKRKCTDLLFLIAIIGGWVAMTVIGINAITNGNIDILLNGIDYNGRICGVSEGVQNMSKWYLLNYNGAGVCVSECPSKTNYEHLLSSTDPSDKNKMKCIFESDYSTYAPDAYDSASWDSLTPSEAVEDKVCNFQFNTTEFLGRYCLFLDLDQVKEALSTAVSVTPGGDYLTELMRDMYTARGIIFGFGIGIAALVGYLFIFIIRIRFVAKLMIWVCIGLILGVLLSLGYFFYSTGVSWEKGSMNDQQRTKYEIRAIKILGIISFVAAGLWFCLVLFLRKRINLAIEIVREAARAVQKMPTMMLIPLLQSAGIVIFLVPWVIYLLYLASLGTFTTTTSCVESSSVCVSYKSFVYDTETKKKAWFLLFMWFWTSEFVIALGYLTIALCVARWYFSRDKSKLGMTTVFSSICICLFYHTGTCSFGALLLAIVKMARAILSYLEKKKSVKMNIILRVVIGCCICCLWCFEKCLRFLEMNAYVQTAIFSYNFCTAARKAFSLLLRNILRVASVSVVGSFLMFIGKIFITVVTSAIFYYYISTQMENQLYSFTAPTIIVIVLSWFTAKVFMGIFDMAVIAMLQCFLSDEEMFEDKNQCFAEHGLARTLNKLVKQSSFDNEEPVDDDGEPTVSNAKEKQ